MVWSTVAFTRKIKIQWQSVYDAIALWNQKDCQDCNRSFPHTAIFYSAWPLVDSDADSDNHYSA